MTQFTDPLTECLSCHKRFRADHLIEAYEAKHGHPPPNGLADIRDPETAERLEVATEGLDDALRLRSAELSGPTVTVAALSVVSYGGLFTFLASSSFVFIRVLALSKTQYGLVMLAMSACYVAGTFMCRRLLPHRHRFRKFSGLVVLFPLLNQG